MHLDYILLRFYVHVVIHNVARNAKENKKRKELIF